MQKKIVAAVAATMAAMLTQAHATQFAYEGFNYTEDVGTPLLGLNGGTGWEAAYPDSASAQKGVLTDGLSFPGVNDNVGLAMRQAGNSNLSSGRAWDTAPVLADGAYWYSMMVKPQATLGRGTLIPFRDPTGSADGQNGAGLRIDNDGTTGVKFLAWTPQQTGGTPEVIFTGGYDRTYMVFGRLIVDSSAPSASSSRIWVYQDSAPALPADEAAILAITTGNTSAAIINNIGGVTNLSPVLSGRGFGNSTGLIFDEIRIGDTYADVLPSLGAVVPTWAASVSGDWFRATNWQASTIPNGIDATARFLNASSARTVFTDAPVTVGTLNFAGANRFNITGNGTLTLEVTTGSAAIAVASGSHKLNLPVTLNSNTTTDVSTGAELVIADPLNLNGKTFTHNGAGTVTIISTVNPGAGGGLVIAGSLLAADMSLNGSTLSVTSGQATFGSNQLLSSLEISGTGKVDIGLHSVAVDYTGTNPLASIVSAAQSGALFATGLPSNAAIAVADNASLGLASFADASVDATSVLIRGTLKGDATLDGTVNFDDLLKLAASYNASAGVGWANGDFDYSGGVNFDDLLLLAANYNQSLTGSLGGDWALALSSVPEPTSLALLAAGAALITRRRR